MPTARLSVVTIAGVMDALKGHQNEMVALTIEPRGTSLAACLRSGKPKRSSRSLPELIAFDGLMRRCNKYYGQRLKDEILLRAIAEVAEHMGLLIGDVRRMTLAQFNTALDEALERTPSGSKGGNEAVFDATAGKLSLNGTSLALTSSETYLLRLLVAERAVSLGKLKTACSRPDKVLRRLLDKYPGLGHYVTRPGRKGRGGYSTTITPVESAHK